MIRGYLSLRCSGVRELTFNVALFVQCVLDAQHCNSHDDDNSNSTYKDNKKESFFG